MKWNIIDKKRYILLKNIVEKVSVENYYMVGGTALSLQLGLRESFDFDFCVTNHFNNNLLLEELKTIGNVEIKQNQTGTLDIILDDVQVSFFYFPNEIVGEFVVPDEIKKLKIANVIDIATMKLIAIGGRGAKKDFFDLYYIMQKSDITIEKLVKALIEKYGKNINYMNTIMGLTYFEDAEEEILPKTFVENSWNEIKKFFIDFQNRFQSELEKRLL